MTATAAAPEAYSADEAAEKPFATPVAGRRDNLADHWENVQPSDCVPLEMGGDDEPSERPPRTDVDNLIDDILGDD